MNLENYIRSTLSRQGRSRNDLLPKLLQIAANCLYFVVFFCIYSR
jgi:hypothetical protein